MRHSHNQSRARQRVQHPTYLQNVFDSARLRNTTGHVRYFLGAVVRVFVLYLILLLAVCISAQLITSPGSEIPTSDPDWPNPDLFSGSMDDVWRHVEQDDECFHCLFEEWMKDDPGMSDLLSCPLSDEVTTIPVHVRPTHLLPSMKRCTAFNAMIRRMTVLVITFLRQVAVSLLVTFLGLSTLLHEEMLAHPATRKKGEKDAFSPRRKESAFEFIFVPSPFTIGVAVVKRYKRLAVYKELHNLLLKFPSLKLRRRTKFARRIHGQLVVSFSVRRSCVIRIRFKHSKPCLALLRCIACLVKRLLAKAVSAMPSVLVCGLLLLAGDVEVNPGPITVAGILKKHEDEFFQVINAKFGLLRLVRKGVITEDVKSSIDGSSTNIDTQEILYSHLERHADMNTLREYCKVAMKAKECPKMQEFGRKILAELPQGGDSMALLDKSPDISPHSTPSPLSPAGATSGSTALPQPDAVERIQSLSIISEDSDIRQVLSRLQIPRRNIPAGQQPEIYFSVLLAGPFSVPEDCHIVSSILYINYHNIQKKQLEFRLNHWYAGKNRQKTMTFLKSPSVLNESSVYPFEKHSHGSFSDDEQLAVLSLDVDPCLLCVAVEKTGNLLYPVNCSLQLLKKTQTSCITAFRLYVTYTHDSWTKEVEHIMTNAGWQTVAYAPLLNVTLKDHDDGIKATFEPNSGNGWIIVCQGKQTVLLSELCDPCLPRDQRHGKFEEYLPCIHYNLMYAVHPSARAEVDTTLKISTYHSPTDRMSIPVHIPGYVASDDTDKGDPNDDDTGDVGGVDDIGEGAGEVGTTTDNMENGEDYNSPPQPGFEDAVTQAKDAKVDITVSKVVLLGPPEAGKTQLVSALLGKYEIADYSTPFSTNAKLAFTTQLMTTDDSGPLQLLTIDAFQKRLYRSAHEAKDREVQPQTAAPGISQASAQPEGYHATVEPRQASEVCSMGFASEDIPKPNFSDTIKTDFANLLNDVNSRCPAYSEEKTLQVHYIHLIDNGGQPAFFDAHPVVATSGAIYLLVYNMQEGLDAKPKYTYRRRGRSEDEKQPPSVPNDRYTNLDLLQASLQTISNLKDKFCSIEEKLVADPQTHVPQGKPAGSSYVLVVGTRYGKPIEEGEEIGSTDWEEAHDVLEEKCTTVCSAWNSVQKCKMSDGESQKRLFPVNSRNEACPGVQAVCEKIISRTFGLTMRMSIKWFHCHLLFWHAKEETIGKDSEEKRYPQFEVLLFSKLFDLCKEHELVSNKEELLAMVRAFHVLGLFFFPALDQEEEGWMPDDEPVFTNPDLLYGELTKILEIAFEESFPGSSETGEDPRLFNQLKDYGELTPTIMGRLGIPDALDAIPDFHEYLLEQLSTWGLAAKLPASILQDSRKAATNNPVYFVPSVLQPFQREDSSTCDPVLDPNALCISLTIYDKSAHTYYIPNGAFTHFVVKLLQPGYNYHRRKLCQGERHCYSDSIDLIRRARGDKQQLGHDYFVRLATCKLESVKVVITSCKAEIPVKECANDYYQIIWNELRVAMAEACKQMFHKKESLEITVATVCRYCKDRYPSPYPNLAKLRIADKDMECLRHSHQRKLPEFLLKVVECNGSHQEAQGRAQSDHLGMSGSRTDSPSASHVQVIKEHAEEFLSEMNAKAIAGPLCSRGHIPQAVKYNISESPSQEDANSCLLDFLKEQADERQIQGIFQVASAATKYGRMSIFATKLLLKFPQGQATTLPPNTTSTEGQPTLRYRFGSPPTTPTTPDPHTSPTSLYPSPLQLVLIVAILVLVLCFLVLVLCLLFVYR